MRSGHGEVLYVFTWLHRKTKVSPRWGLKRWRYSLITKVSPRWGSLWQHLFFLYDRGIAPLGLGLLPNFIHK